MALLLSGVGLLVVPGAGAEKITESNGCGVSKDAAVRSDEIKIIGTGDCCSSESSSVRGDEVKSGDDGSGSSCGDTDGTGSGNDSDSDDNSGGNGCQSDSSVVRSDSVSGGDESSDCDEVGGVDNDNDGDDVGGTTGPTGPTGATGATGTTGTTGTTTTTTTTSGVTTTALSGIQQIKGASASKGKPKACTSRRLFVIHIRYPHGQYLVSANVTVNGKRVATMRGHRISSTIRLVGLPKGTVKVHIRAVTNTGKVLHGVRTYHTCVAGRHGSIPKL